MTNATKTPAATKPATPAPAADAAPAPKTKGVQPLFAIHEINPFGKGKHAPAGSVFTPVNETERKELKDMGAARELEEHEAIVFASAPVAPSEDEFE